MVERSDRIIQGEKGGGGKEMEEKREGKREEKMSHLHKTVKYYSAIISP